MPLPVETLAAAIRAAAEAVGQPVVLVVPNGISGASDAIADMPASAGDAEVLIPAAIVGKETTKLDRLTNEHYVERTFTVPIDGVPLEVLPGMAFRATNPRSGQRELYVIPLDGVETTAWSVRVTGHRR